MTDNPASLVERLADVLCNADLDGPEPDDYWRYLAHCILPIIEAERTAAIAAARDAAFEEAACAADRFAENKRANGIDGHCDPLEAVAFDEALTDFAQLLRSNKSSPDTQDSRTTKDTDHAS